MATQPCTTKAQLFPVAPSHRVHPNPITATLRMCEVRAVLTSCTPPTSSQQLSKRTDSHPYLALRAQMPEFRRLISTYLRDRTDEERVGPAICAASISSRGAGHPGWIRRRRNLTCSRSRPGDKR